MNSMTRCLAAAVAGVLLASGAFAAPRPDPAVASAQAYRTAHGSEILAGFARFLAIPNTAAHPEGLRQTAEHIAAELGKRGAQSTLWTLPGQPTVPPVVFAALDSPGAKRTIGIYFHYDGQPVDAAEWRSGGPFEPTLYTRALEAGGTKRGLPAPGEPIDPEWRLYARAAGDDKAPLPAILAALDALSAAGISRTSNLRFLAEGEEESGSDHLGAYFDAHRAELDAIDYWLICDGPAHQSGKPQLVFGVRGVVGFELTVYGATRPLHSGHYGNWAPNPGQSLAELLASMKDEDGNVTIAGYYDTTIPPGPGDRAALAALPAPDDALRAELGLADTAATEGRGALLAERLLLPSLNLRGMASGAVAAGAANVIPTRATASLDIRLVAGNDPEHMLDLVEAHVRAQGYHLVRDEPDLATRRAHAKIARFTRQSGYPAARTPIDDPASQQVIKAATRVTGEPPLLVPGLGGSLPLYLFTQKLARPTIIVPIANHDNNQHAADENLRVGNLWYGIDLMSALLTLQ